MDDNFQRERQTIDNHLHPEQIVAYHERRLPPDEAEKIRAHLVDCPDCTAELLPLAGLYDEDGSAGDILPTELDAAWERQRERLFPAAPVTPMESRREVRPPRRDWRIAAPFALAASLLAVVALVQWRTIVRLDTPRANPPLVNLEPVDAARQGSEAASELRIPAESERAWVILNPTADIHQDSSYSVDVAAPDGKVVLRFEDLAVSEVGNFRLELPRSSLGTGDWMIYLYEESGDRRPLIGQFPLSVQISPSSSP